MEKLKRYNTRFSQRISILLILLIASVWINIFYIFIKPNFLSFYYPTNRTADENSFSTNYPLLFSYPKLAGINSHYEVNLKPLKTSISDRVGDKLLNQVGVYVESLNTGAWLGINEKQVFQPASLIKVPIAIAVFQMVEDGKINLDTPLEILKKDRDPSYGDLYEETSERYFTVDYLLTALLGKSDNTAASRLVRELDAGYLSDIYQRLGLETLDTTLQSSPTASAKDYANIFRSLYYSTLLEKTYSNRLLDKMTKSSLGQGLAEGIPENIRLSHKSGLSDKTGSFHDCGVAYVPENPFFVCVMTKNLSDAEARGLAKDIAAITYRFFRSDAAEAQ